MRYDVDAYGMPEHSQSIKTMKPLIQELSESQCKTHVALHEIEVKIPENTTRLYNNCLHRQDCSAHTHGGGHS